METTPTYYIDLIARYFFGETTPEEVLELEKWVMTNPENREVFSAYRKTWEMLNNSKALSSLELDREWNILTSKLNGNLIDEKSEQLSNNPFKSSSVAGNPS